MLIIVYHVVFLIRDLQGYLYFGVYFTIILWGNIMPHKCAIVVFGILGSMVVFQNGKGLDSFEMAVALEEKVVRKTASRGLLINRKAWSAMKLKQKASCKGTF